jgi:hypothetical protein
LAYRPQGQISNHGRACTEALLLYKKFLIKVGNFSFLEMATPIQTTTLNLGIDQKEKKKQQQTFFLNKQNKPSVKPT